MKRNLWYIYQLDSFIQQLLWIIKTLRHCAHINQTIRLWNIKHVCVHSRKKKKKNDTYSIKNSTHFCSKNFVETSTNRKGGATLKSNWAPRNASLIKKLVKKGPRQDQKLLISLAITSLLRMRPNPARIHNIRKETRASQIVINERNSDSNMLMNKKKKERR